MAMVLDECLGYPATRGRGGVDAAFVCDGPHAAVPDCELLRTAPPEGTAISNQGQAQFGIIQGGVFPALRRESADATVEIAFELSIGGLSVGEPIEYSVVQGDGQPLARNCTSIPHGGWNT